MSEVDGTVTSRLRANQRTAPVQALAGQYAGEFVADALVLAKHVANLAPAHADVASRNVCVGSNVARKLRHEGLAKTHYLVVGLALGIKVRTALTAAHGQSSERVFENLLKAEELQNRQVHRRVKAESALIGSDGTVEFHAVAAVYVHVAGVVGPRNTEHDGALGLGDAL